MIYFKVNDKIKYKYSKSNIYFSENKYYIIVDCDYQYNIYTTNDNTGYEHYMSSKFVKENFIKVNFLENKIAKIRKLVK